MFNFIALQKQLSNFETRMSYVSYGLPKNLIYLRTPCPRTLNEGSAAVDLFKKILLLK